MLGLGFRVWGRVQGLGFRLYLGGVDLEGLVELI